MVRERVFRRRKPCARTPGRRGEPDPDRCPLARRHADDGGGGGRAGSVSLPAVCSSPPARSPWSPSRRRPPLRCHGWRSSRGTRIASATWCRCWRRRPSASAPRPGAGAQGAPVAAVVLMIVAGVETRADVRRRADDRRGAMGSAERRRAAAGHRLPRTAVRRHDDHGEHGIPRPLHAGTVAFADSAIRDFLHEGNGDIWLSAIVRARPFAGWVLIEEYAEGGDILLVDRAREPAAARRVLASVRRRRRGALSAELTNVLPQNLILNVRR